MQTVLRALALVYAASSLSAAAQSPGQAAAGVAAPAKTGSAAAPAAGKTPAGTVATPTTVGSAAAPASGKPAAGPVAAPARAGSAAAPAAGKAPASTGATPTTVGSAAPTSGKPAAGSVAAPATGSAAASAAGKAPAGAVATPIKVGSANTPALNTSPAGADARAQQQAAMAAMQESLAKQRAAIQKQTGQGDSRGFFLLPAPPAMGPSGGLLEQAECDPLPDLEVEELIGKTATRVAVDPTLLRSVMKQESGFRPCAVSPKGAQGLMQLMPATAEQFGVHNAFDPAENVDAGARLLKQLLVRYAGDLPKTLAAYNAGPTTVDAANGVPQIPETLDYIRRILPLLPRM